ncbi:MAG: type III pantothenate kinase [Bacteroidales bacterium]|nr:type III pantothenate kinase [Bacteroidales bacterium]
MNKILTIDIGNTRAKYAVFDDDIIIETGVFDPYSNDLKEIIIRHHKIKKGILSSVGGKVEECLEQLKEIEVVTLSGLSPLPFDIPYANKKQIGSDRIAAVAGAMSIKPNENNLIIDIGTCITYDIITSDNIYHCGPISPGIRLRFKSMNDYTNKLPLCTATKDDLKIICESTEECLQSGVLMAISLEIEGFIKLYSNNYKNLNVFIIGGDNIFFENKLKNCIFADANFIFNGLRYILNYQ